MCDCYAIKCACGKKYVPIHIGDYDFPRSIILRVYCPDCIPVIRWSDDYYPIEHKDDIYKITYWTIKNILICVKNKDAKLSNDNEDKFKGYAIVFKFPKLSKTWKRLGKEIAMHLYHENVYFNGNPFDDKHRQ